jgi:predicted GIY-YIG superfamily endonuclease
MHDFPFRDRWVDDHTINDILIVEIMEYRGRRIDVVSYWEWINDAWVYVLELVDGKWYVGVTTDMEKRMDSHVYKRKTRWIKIYRVVGLHEKVQIDRIIGEEYTKTVHRVEDKKTLEIMKKYGWDNVRGGRWTDPSLSEPPIPELYKGGTLKRFFFE